MVLLYLQKGSIALLKQSTLGLQLATYRSIWPRNPTPHLLEGSEVLPRYFYRVRTSFLCL